MNVARAVGGAAYYWGMNINGALGAPPPETTPVSIDPDNVLHLTPESRQIARSVNELQTCCRIPGALVPA